MTMTIQEALQALDPQNDEHWTSDGSPRMDTLQELTGDESLTRKQVREIAPTFTRETAGQTPPEDPGVSPETEQGATAAPPTQDDEDEQETPPVDEDDDRPEEGAEDDEAALAEEDDLTRELEEAEAELAEREAELAERRKEIDQVRARRDELVERRDRAKTPHDDTVERMNFIRRQAQLRAERAGEAQLARELAMQAKGLAGASALDQSMARRMGRGHDRPPARPLKNVKE